MRDAYSILPRGALERLHPVLLLLKPKTCNEFFIVTADTIFFEHVESADTIFFETYGRGAAARTAKTVEPVHSSVSGCCENTFSHLS